MPTLECDRAGNYPQENRVTLSLIFPDDSRFAKRAGAMIIWPILWITAIFAMVISVIVVAVAESKARRRAAEVVRQQQAALQQSQMDSGMSMSGDDGMGGDMGMGGGQGSFDIFDGMK